MRSITLGIASIALASSISACSSAAECELDSDCGSGVCARDGACTTSDDVRSVKTTWTINGAPASEGACRGLPLYIAFADDDTGETLEFDPVPCALGQYLIDKLPRRFDSVEVGVDVDGGPWDATTIDAAGTARLDLPLGPAAAAAAPTAPTHDHRRRHHTARPQG